MTLPIFIERCPGRRSPESVDVDKRTTDEACVPCARRTAGVADYMGGAAVTWMKPATDAECAERLLPKGERHA